MTIKRKSFTVNINKGEKRAISIAAQLCNKFPAPFCRDVALDHAQKIIADHEKNNASRDKKDALEKAIKDYDNKGE